MICLLEYDSTKIEKKMTVPARAVRGSGTKSVKVVMCFSWVEPAGVYSMSQGLSCLLFKFSCVTQQSTLYVVVVLRTQ